MLSIFPTQSWTFKAINAGYSRIFLAGFTNVLAASGVPAFVTDIWVEDKDVTLPVVALDDKRVIYSFGKNFSNASITGRIYIFGCDSVTNVLGGMLGAFNTYRIASHLHPVNLSVIGMGGHKVYPTELKFSNADATHQYISFTVTCIVAPISNK